jgi:1,4-alpha-glucan branching enzyme
MGVRFNPFTRAARTARSVDPARRSPLSRVARCIPLLALAVLTAGCSLLGFIEDRLDPPAPTARGILFRYKAPAARQVNLAGEFNNWLGTVSGRLDPNIDPMKDLDGDGIWEITLPLPPGRYQYKYVIDQVDWQEDPSNPETIDDGYGGFNSILVVPPDVPYKYDEAYVSYSLGTKSRIKRTYAHEFTLKGHADAKHVFVTGDFADWDPEGMAMELDAEGVWRASVDLEEGDHLYKFVVDGTWMADPDNPDSVDDGYGGKNSVAHVQP